MCYITQSVLTFGENSRDYIIVLIEGLSVLFYIKHFEDLQQYNKHNHYINVGHYFYNC